MAKFQHFITTTFNVPSPDWNKTRDGKTALSDEWFRDRIDIFGRYCLPSFKNQSCQKFVWLVFFDEKTPDFYKETIKKIEQEFPLFQPFFVKDMDEKKVSLLEQIKTQILPDTQFIITTDIDNDDILHQDFVKTIQQNFKPIHNLVIDLRRGLQLTRKNEKEAFVNEYYSAGNPFVSIVEDVKKNWKTMAGYFHNDTRKFADVTVYDQKPMFIQLIHSFNMLNATSPNKRFSKINLNEFGIKKEYQWEISGMETFMYNARRKANLVLKKIFYK